MKALVYGGPGEKSWTDAPDPVILHPTDAIVPSKSESRPGTWPRKTSWASWGRDPLAWRPWKPSVYRRPAETLMTDQRT
ncbi:hypothetical protein [Paenarthrobacter sp. NPDC091669]|uniref:hypothetical protein n=1 Tax=Paenarthrobacter sp. NPDC091669 TaxID=3364384 RepID=UPI003817144B